MPNRSTTYKLQMAQLRASFYGYNTQQHIFSSGSFEKRDTQAINKLTCRVIFRRSHFTTRQRGSHADRRTEWRARTGHGRHCATLNSSPRLAAAATDTTPRRRGSPRTSFASRCPACCRGITGDPPGGAVVNSPLRRPRSSAAADSF